MTDTIKISRELAEQICVELEHDNDRYMLGRELRKALATPPADAADMGGQAGEEVEVRGLQWLDTGHYRKKPPQFSYNPHDWNPLMTVAQHQRITAAMAAEVERLRADNEALARNLKGKHATTGATYEHLIAERDALHADAEALRAQRDKMAQILRDLVPGCKWRFMRPRIDAALAEIDNGN